MQTIFVPTNVITGFIKSLLLLHSVVAVIKTQVCNKSLYGYLYFDDVYLFEYLRTNGLNTAFTLPFAYLTNRIKGFDNKTDFSSYCYVERISFEGCQRITFVNTKKTVGSFVAIWYRNGIRKKTRPLFYLDVIMRKFTKTKFDYYSDPCLTYN